MMRCGNCIYYNDNICYEHGTRVGFHSNICEKFIRIPYDDKGLDLKK